MRNEYPEYQNSQIKELIQEHIHNEVDRKMLFLRLVNGKTFYEIHELVKLDEKTVRRRIHKGEEALFRHVR